MVRRRATAGLVPQNVTLNDRKMTEKEKERVNEELVIKKKKGSQSH